MKISGIDNGQDPALHIRWIIEVYVSYGERPGFLASAGFLSMFQNIHPMGARMTSRDDVMFYRAVR